MTKPAVYKVKLASGVTRHIVAWEFDHVAAMRFESAPDASLPPSFDAIRGIEWVMDCDAVLFRDVDLPKPAPARELLPIRAEKCPGCHTETEVQPETVFDYDGTRHSCPDPTWRTPTPPTVEACSGCLGFGEHSHETLPSEAKSTWSVGDFCPMACGTKLRSSLGQLICGMGHQIGEAKDMGNEWQPGFRSTMRKLQEWAGAENAKPERQRVPHGLGCQCPDCTKEAAQAL